MAQQNEENNFQKNKTLEQLIEENLVLSREIYKISEKTKHYMLIGQIMGGIKLILIVAPIILGFIFLQPYVKQLMGVYNGLLGGSSGETIIKSTNLIQEVLKNQATLEKTGINLKSR